MKNPPVDGTLIALRDTGIASIGYLNTHQVLVIEFTTGAQYLHYDVPEKVFVEFLSAGKPGYYHRARIKGRYRSEKIRNMNPKKPVTP